MKITKKADDIKPSLTRALFNKAKLYDDVIDLTLGDPDLDMPEEIKKAGYNAIMRNKSHYSANAGLYEAREAISKRVRSIWRVECEPDKNLIVTVGGMEALYLSLLSIIDAGDEVIIFAPYYVNYIQMVMMCGGVPVIIDSYDEKKGFCVDSQKLKESVTDRTVAIIVNTPNNPTGDIMSKESLKAIADAAVENDLTVISDEVYRTLVYDNNIHTSILEFENIRDRVVLIDSLSKEYSMTGWRIGYAYGSSQIINTMIKFQENVAACANVPAQYALIEAYGNNIKSDYIAKEFQNRRDYVCDFLGNIEELFFCKPKATFYLFVDISRLNISSEKFAYSLLEEQHVAVVPGIAYGDRYDKYIRIAFTKDMKELEIGMKRIKKYIEYIKSV